VSLISACSSFALIRFLLVCSDSFLLGIAQNGAGCGYVEWADPALPEFWSHLIGDLRDAVWRLRSDGVLSVSQQNEETEPSVQA